LCITGRRTVRFAFGGCENAGRQRRITGALRAVRQARIAIVFVTGYFGELLQEVRDNSPYDEVLPKPFQLNELVEVVNWPPPINE
jgi:CheY-like chemotaxis protein